MTGLAPVSRPLTNHRAPAALIVVDDVAIRTASLAALKGLGCFTTLATPAHALAALTHRASREGDAPRLLVVGGATLPPAVVAAERAAGWDFPLILVICAREQEADWGEIADDLVMVVAEADEAALIARIQRRAASLLRLATRLYDLALRHAHDSHPDDLVNRHTAELERHIGDLVMLYEAGRDLASTLAVDEIYRLIDREIAQRLFNAVAVRIYRYHEAARGVHLVYEDGAARNGPARPLVEEALALAIRSERGVLTDDRAFEPLVNRDRVIGVLEIQPGAFGDFNELNVMLLSTLAGQAAAALDNAYLYAEMEARVQEHTAELRAALSQANALSAMRARFLSNVQHEFRTPVTRILSSSELLERYSERMSPEDRDRRFVMIREAVNEIIYLLESTLLVNNLEDEAYQLNTQSVDLAQLTRTCLADFLYSHLATDPSASQPTVVAHLPDQPHIARIDPFLWRRLLTELLTNAVRYARSAAGATLVVRLEGDARRLTLTVTDDGIGIAPDDLPHVTELFYRGVNVQNLPGSGIGLAIVKRIVDLNGGDLEIDSTMGEGTTVTIVLPSERSEAEE